MMQTSHFLIQAVVTLVQKNCWKKKKKNIILWLEFSSSIKQAAQQCYTPDTSKGEVQNNNSEWGFHKVRISGSICGLAGFAPISRAMARLNGLIIHILIAVWSNPAWYTETSEDICTQAQGNNYPRGVLKVPQVLFILFYWFFGNYFWVV